MNTIHPGDDIPQYMPWAFGDTLDAIDRTAHQFVMSDHEPTGSAYPVRFGYGDTPHLTGKVEPYWRLAGEPYGDPRALIDKCLFAGSESSLREMTRFLSEADLIDADHAAANIRQIGLERQEIVIAGYGYLGLLQAHAHAAYNRRNISRTVIPARAILAQVIDVTAVRDGYLPADLKADFLDQLRTGYGYVPSERARQPLPHGADVVESDVVRKPLESN